LCTIGCHPNNYIIEDLGHSWDTPLKNCLGAVFNKGLIRHLIFGKPCIFKALRWVWFSKVNGPALPKKRCIKVGKAPPEKNGSEKKLLTIEAHPPPFRRYSIIFEKISPQRSMTLIGILYQLFIYIYIIIIIISIIYFFYYY